MRVSLRREISTHFRSCKKFNRLQSFVALKCRSNSSAISYPVKNCKLYSMDSKLYMIDFLLCPMNSWSYSWTSHNESDSFLSDICYFRSYLSDVLLLAISTSFLSSLNYLSPTIQSVVQQTIYNRFFPSSFYFMFIYACVCVCYSVLLLFLFSLFFSSLKYKCNKLFFSEKKSLVVLQVREREVKCMCLGIKSPAAVSRSSQLFCFSNVEQLLLRVMKKNFDK